MVQAIRAIPVEHHPAVHEVDASRAETGLPLTLLELVFAVSEASDSETEVVATLLHMLQSGRIRLIGSFRDVPTDTLCD